MSRAYICDKCGKIQEESMPSIWVVNPQIFIKYEEGFAINLCDKCYKQFRRDYMENLDNESECK